MRAQIASLFSVQYFFLTSIIALFVSTIIFTTGFYIVPILAVTSLLLIVIFAFTVKPMLLMLAYICLLPIYLETNEGVTGEELVFLLFTALIALIYFFIPLITGRLDLSTPLDKLFLFFTLLLPAGSLLGLLNGANAYNAFGDLTYFAGIFIYFPFRNHYHNELFKKWAFFLFGLVLLYVMIRNAYYYQQIILQAYMPWQLENARIASNEVLILLAVVFCTVSVLLIKNYTAKIALLIIFIGAVASLILTQSRGYWIAYATSLLVIFFSTERKNKRTIFLYFIFISGAGIILSNLFFPDYFELVATALIERFKSIGSSTQIDISVLERIDETKRVFSKILYNPIVGYGFGVEYVKYIFFERIHVATSYVHNGYLAAWYKLGLPGIFLFISIYYYTIRNSYFIYKKHSVVLHRIISLSIIATLFAMLLVNITSPQFLQFDSILLMTLFAVYSTSEKKQPDAIISDNDS